MSIRPEKETHHLTPFKTMLSNNKKLIAVIGATGRQGGGVVRALQAGGGQFKVRALSRNPVKHRDLADEVVEADLNRPDTLQPAFADAHGTWVRSHATELRSQTK